MGGPLQLPGTLLTASRPANVVRFCIAPPKANRDPKRPTLLRVRPMIASAVAQIEHVAKLSETILAEALQRVPPPPPQVKSSPEPRPDVPGPLVKLSAASRVSRTVAPEDLVARLAGVPSAPLPQVNIDPPATSAPDWAASPPPNRPSIDENAAAAPNAASTGVAPVSAARAGNGGAGSGGAATGTGGAMGRGSPGQGGALDGMPSGVASNPLPPYPPEALARGVQGRVLLRVWILDDGSVRDVKLYQSSGDESLDRSALSTVRDRWRFVPGSRAGFAVPCEVILPIRFRAAGRAS
jgi:protein TonB